MKGYGVGVTCVVSGAYYNSFVYETPESMVRPSEKRTGELQEMLTACSVYAYVPTWSTLDLHKWPSGTGNLGTSVQFLKLLHTVRERSGSYRLRRNVTLTKLLYPTQRPF